MEGKTDKIISGCIDRSGVEAICEMQRKIDAYETYIMSFVGITTSKEKSEKDVTLLQGTDMDEWASQVVRNIRSMWDRIDE